MRGGGLAFWVGCVRDAHGMQKRPFFAREPANHARPLDGQPGRYARTLTLALAHGGEMAVPVSYSTSTNTTVCVHRLGWFATWGAVVAAEATVLQVERPLPACPYGCLVDCTSGGGGGPRWLWLQGGIRQGQDQLRPWRAAATATATATADGQRQA